MKEGKGIYSQAPSASLSEKLLRKKPFEKSLSEASSQKTLTWYDLTAYGIAATVGSGIYVTVGSVARNNAGPSVIISTFIAGFLSLLTGICYLEFASALPISGSGYAYFYTLLGEFFGWFIGWNLTLEYGFAAASISEGWTKYFVNLSKKIGWTVPSWMYKITFFETLPMFRLNLLAGFVVLLLGFLVTRGAKFGTRFTNVITVTNLSIICFIIGAGSLHVKPSNWTPFVPSIPGIFSGAGEMFFSFIGYDTVSTLAAEAINPARDIPIAIGLTVGVATTLYMLVGLVITGIVPFGSLDCSNPLTMAFAAVGSSWAYYIIAVAALLMMASTMFACLVGQPKIFQAIAIDGLLPSALAKENSKGTPIASVAFSTLLIALAATFFDADHGLTDMIVFGTLFGMSTLCAAVIVCRFDQKDSNKSLGTYSAAIFQVGALLTSFISRSYSTYCLAASGILTMLIPFGILVYLFVVYRHQLYSRSTAFACPLMPLIPCMAIAVNSYIMMSLKDLSTVFLQFTTWTAIGWAIYFGYGIHNSHLDRRTGQGKA
jgi:APA family basic amino acid/polyamine antiporter